MVAKGKITKYKLIVIHIFKEKIGQQKVTE